MIRTTSSKWVMAMSVSCLLAALGVTATTFAQDAQSDAEITVAIENQFLRDATLSPLRIEVTTQEGIASLDATVRNLLEKQHAAEVAEAVRGVRAVLNRIRVAPSERSPAEIEAAVKRELAQDPAAEGYEIAVSADTDGMVTLTGTVDSWTERNLAERVATMARGVTGIRNGIVVDVRAEYRDETEIANEVEARLRWDTLVDDSLIGVLGLQGGRVILSGTVGSAAEKRRAIADTQVAGVREVDADHLEVEPWARNENLRDDAAAAKTDDEVSDAIMQSFAYDPRVLGQEVEVVVAQGGVRLLGTVDNLQAKRAAAQDAHNTVGVRAVSNELEVVPEPISDEALEHQVTSALEGAGLLEDNAISVDVEDGKVELSGNLENTPDYWHAEELARSARGAVAVENNLSVNGEARIRTAYAYGFYPDMFYGLPGEAVEPLPTDRQIHADVESEFFWSPFVDEDTISVGVDDGIVTLTGTVDSNREKQIAADNALEGGALRVDNEIEVRGN